MNTKKVWLTLGVVALLLAAGGPVSAAALPSDSVGAVTLSKANVCSADTSENVSATVTGSYDSSGPTPSSSCIVCNAGNDNCGTFNTSVKRKGTVTTTTVTVSNKTVTASASDSNGNSTPSQGPSASPMAFSQSLTASGSDGKITVTVSATASEDVKTDTSTTVTNYTSTSSCSGTTVGSPTTTPSTSTVTKTSAVATNTATYVLDLIGPTAELLFNNPPSIMQTQNELVSVKINNGSAGTPWTVNLTATGPDPATTTTLPATDTGSIGPANPAGSGINNNTVTGPVALPTACDTPVGLYTLTATVKTQDLCEGSYPDIVLAGDPFTVTPGITLATQTVVLSQLTTGDYGINQCFVDSVKQQAKKLIVNNTPGSVHIGTIVTTAGPCAGLGTISGVQFALTLPPLAIDDGSGFVYADTGASPVAHVFVGDGRDGFDLHNGTPLTEVTGLITATGQTRTIDLSSLGDISATDTIFARAHAVFKAFAKGDQPAADTPFHFSSSATTAEGLSDSSDYFISGNPQHLMDNLTGVVDTSLASCDSDGLF